MDRGDELGLRRCPLPLPSPCVPGHACDADAEQGNTGGFGNTLRSNEAVEPASAVLIPPRDFAGIAEAGDKRSIAAGHIKDRDVAISVPYETAFCNAVEKIPRSCAGAIKRVDLCANTAGRVEGDEVAI